MAKDTNDYQYWSKQARKYDAASTFIVGAQAQEATRSWLRSQLSATDCAVELGCGTGFFSRVIAECVQHLTATDLSPEMLAGAQAQLKNCPNVLVQAADASCAQLPEQSFDVVFLGNLVHIVSQPLAVLDQAHRLLKPGGRLLLIDSTMQGMPALAQMAMAVRYVSQYGLPPKTNKNYRLDELAALAQRAGFEVREAQVISRETNALCVAAGKTHRSS